MNTLNNLLLLILLTFILLNTSLILFILLHMIKNILNYFCFVSYHQNKIKRLLYKTIVTKFMCSSMMKARVVGK